MSKLQESKNNLQETIGKIKFGGMSLFLFFILFSSSVSAQQDFDKFLVNFKKAVAKNDKKSVVQLTNFPITYADENTAEQEKEVSYSKQEFLNRYANFFDKSRRQCFKNNTSFAINDSNIKGFKSIECKESNSPRGIVYSFLKTSIGWKLNGIAIE